VLADHRLGSCDGHPFDYELISASAADDSPGTRQRSIPTSGDGDTCNTAGFQDDESIDPAPADATSRRPCQLVPNNRYGTAFALFPRPATIQAQFYFSKRSRRLL
jgi:hypothetical protein